jgi:hypothetical protein
MYLRDIVEGVDDDQAEGDQEDDPGRHHVRGDQERHPAKEGQEGKITPAKTFYLSFFVEKLMVTVSLHPR